MTAVVLAGGGLANSLIAWRLAQLRPEVPLTAPRARRRRSAAITPGLSTAATCQPAQLEWMRPLVAHAWDAQTVRFPGYERRLRTPYYSITSGRLHAVVAAALGEPRAAELRHRRGRRGRRAPRPGETVAGSLVIDGRGAPPIRGFDLAWQKFLGMEVDLARAARARRPGADGRDGRPARRLPLRLRAAARAAAAADRGHLLQRLPGPAHRRAAGPDPGIRRRPRLRCRGRRRARRPACCRSCSTATSRGSGSEAGVARAPRRHAGHALSSHHGVLAARRGAPRRPHRRHAGARERAGRGLASARSRSAAGASSASSGCSIA